LIQWLASGSGVRELIQEIVDVLQTSTIAEERGKDVRSKFWASYKKVSGEYDDNMLERYNSDMDTLMLFVREIFPYFFFNQFNMHNQAGLFSAVNTAFILAMQPNPVDTTNALLVQLTNITLINSSSSQSSILYPSIDPYYSSNTWTQALAYTSLALSLLAAFGTVMGKQWLGYYKTNRYDRGPLEDRCKQRHRKFQMLETWHFEHALQSFTVLIQISLFLLAISLAAAMWKQQRAISTFLIAMTAFGASCLFFTIVVAVKFPDCPFQTPFSEIIRYCFRHDEQPTHRDDEQSTADAIRWIIHFSTNPDVLVTALELVIAMLSNPTHVVPFLPFLCEKLLFMLEGCFGITNLENNALVYGEALIHLYLNYPQVGATLRRSTQTWKDWVSWRELYLRSALAQCQTSHCLMVNLDNKDPQHQAYTRTALQHMVVAAGASGFNDPDDESLVREGQHQLAFDLPDADWLIECAEHFCGIRDYDAARYAIVLFDSVPKKLSFPIQQRFAQILNKSRPDHKLRVSALCVACHALDYKDNLPCDESFSQAVLTAICPPTIRRDNYDFHLTTVIDLVDLTDLTKYGLTSCNLQNIQLLALLVLPAPKVDEPKRYARYCEALVRYMHPEQPYSFRHTALRKACSARKDLVLIATRLDGSLQNTILSNLSVALLTAAAGAIGNQDSPVFIPEHEIYYVRLIFALAGSSDWRSRLDMDNHINRCIKFIPIILSGSSNGLESPSPCIFYLTGILLRLQPPDLDAVTTKNWWDLTRMAWCVASNSYSGDHSRCISDDLDDDVEILEKLAKETAKRMPQKPDQKDLKSLSEWVGKVAVELEQRESKASKSIYALKSLRESVGAKISPGVVISLRVGNRDQSKSGDQSDRGISPRVKISLGGA